MVSEEFTFWVIVRFLTLAQLVMFFFLASALFKNPRVTRNALLAYALSSVILGVGVLMELPIFAEAITTKFTQGRLTLVGMNANTLATLACLGVLILIGLFRSDLIQRTFFKLLLLTFAVPPLLLAVKTGSRGGIASLVIALAVHLIPSWYVKKTFSKILLAVAAMACITYMAASSDLLSERWENVLEGRLAGRESFIPVTIDMILEKPLLGWYPIQFWHELGERTSGRGETKDAHNLFLHLLLEVGMLGTLPFLIGLWFCWRAAWQARKGPCRLLPLSAFVFALLSSMTHTDLALKYFWFILAFAVASSSSAEPPQRPVVKTRITA